MTYIIIAVVVIFIILGVIGNANNADNKTTRKNNNSANKTKKQVPNSLPTVSELVDKVKTLEDYKKLKADFERIEKSYQSSDNKNTERKYEIYNDAFWKASDKPLFYQFVPDLDLEISDIKIENAYKIFTATEYNDKRKEIGGTEYEWAEINAENYIEK